MISASVSRCMSRNTCRGDEGKDEGEDGGRIRTYGVLALEVHSLHDGVRHVFDVDLFILAHCGVR